MKTEETNLYVRKVGLINWLGLWTLFAKEVMRFVKVGFQTLAAPVVSALMFLLIFKYAFGAARPAVHGVPYTQFLAPGLIMMGILNQAFANSASSMIISKVQGNSVDFLMPPLSAIEHFLAFTGGAAMRGMAVGLCTAIVMTPFAHLHISHWAVLVWFGINAAMMMGMMGLLAGIYANRFDHLAAVQNFLLLPLTMLSGTFYSIRVLPDTFQHLSMVNPFFYLIDGFRYGFTGVSDSHPAIGAIYLLAINIVLAVVSFVTLRSGWRLKS